MIVDKWRLVWEILNVKKVKRQLSQVDLIRADLSNSCLVVANLISANLTGTILTEANLTDANLSGSYL
jgi:uncharacterized protein YjbI with pentapeptide repeats